MKVTALFAGIGGVELGLKQAGHDTLLFCEIDPGAIEVLKAGFPKTPIVQDVRTLKSVPVDTELVTAGFPCQDLSQAGGTKGINGAKSGVVSHLFRLLQHQDIPNVLIENVSFMLHLGHGQAIHFLVDSLEALGYNWAYRVVDTMAFGLPQRRHRVYLLASKEFEPWRVLHNTNCFPVHATYQPGLACGFYWTEGLRGLGWAVDAIPTLKGGSTIGIPSPPAIWMPDGRIVKPDVRDAERLQGFPADWTKPVERVAKKGHRWKLIGNAVSVPAAAWIGQCISSLPHSEKIALSSERIISQIKWPSAAYGTREHERYAVETTKWPVAVEAPHLSDFLHYELSDLSLKAVTGFLDRLTSGSLHYLPEFLEALRAHQSRMHELGGDR